MIDLQMKILTEKAITFSEGEILNRFAEPKQIYLISHVVSAIYETVTVHMLSCVEPPDEYFFVIPNKLYLIIKTYNPHAWLFHYTF